MRDWPALTVQSASPPSGALRVGDTIDWNDRPGTYVVVGPVTQRGGFYLIPVRPIHEQGTC